MTQSESQSIGLVFRWLFGQRQQESHHVLDLGLLGPAGADHGEFDRLGAVLVDLHIALEPRAEYGAARLTELQGGGRVAGEDELFHRHLVWPVLLHYPGNRIEDQAQSPWPGMLVNANTTAGDANTMGTVRVDHPETGCPRARIYAQDAVAQLGLGLHWFLWVRGRGLAETLRP